MNSPKGGNVNQGQPGKTFFPDFICQHIPPSDIKNIQEIKNIIKDNASM